MMHSKPIKVLVVMLLLTAGCQSLPGLRVLTGQDSVDTQQAQQVVQNNDLVMADKSGSVDPSILVAADRIEAADTSVDIVEIRPDIANDTFTVFLMLRPQGNPNSSNQQDIIDFENSIRRAVELTWQATIRDSERFDKLRIEWLGTQDIPTLDNGTSLIAQTIAVVEIDRNNAVDYLARAHNLDDFISLIASGKMTFGAPSSQSLYNGTPNHPIFMVPTPSGQTSNQSSN